MEQKIGNTKNEVFSVLQGVESHVADVVDSKISTKQEEEF